MKANATVSRAGRTEEGRGGEERTRRSGGSGGKEEGEGGGLLSHSTIKEMG